MYKYSDTDKKIIASRVKQFENQVNRRLEGKLTEEEFKPLRLMNYTALKLRQQGIDLARAQLSSFNNLNAKNKAVIKVGSQQNNPYLINNGREQEDISWLL